MTTRWIVTGIAIGSLVAATAGLAFAAGRASGSSTVAPVSEQMAAAHDAMRDPGAMQAVHRQMPAALQASCDTMHEQMDQMIASMMGGSGMTGGGAAVTTAGLRVGHADHRASMGG